jgi:hypothetical protein
VNVAKAFFFGFFATLLLFDFVVLEHKSKKALGIELVVFLGGAMVVAFPDVSTRVAQFIGITRGADLVLYSLAIILTREAILARGAAYEERERMTELVRTLALQQVDRNGQAGQKVIEGP